MNPPTPPIRTYARRAQCMTTRRTQLTKHTKRRPAPTSPAPTPPIRTYARRAQRMTSGQHAHYAHRKNCAYYIDTASAPEHLPRIIDSSQSVILDIGCGMGEATLEYARRNHTHTIIAIEVYKAGIAKVIAGIARHALNNLYIVEADATLLLPKHIKKNSIMGVHIFFPDPWPKSKHHKRRMLNIEMMRLLCTLLVQYGHISFVSDNQQYAREVLICTTQLSLNPMYTAVCRDAPPRWRPRTKFETRALQKGDSIYEIHCRTGIR